MSSSVAQGNSTLPKVNTVWSVEVDGFGAFHSPGVGEQQGNYRITSGDILNIFVPAGSLVNQDDVRLIAVDGIGNESYVMGIYDALGNIIFDWNSGLASSGPCSLTFDYKSFTTNNLDIQKNKNPEQGIRQKGVVNRIIVSPIIQINGVHFKPESLSMQTVMSCCLGTADTWVEKIRYATGNLNYNLVHFTPVQTPGESGSCYSLADQLEVSGKLLPANVNNDSKTAWNLIKKVVKDLETTSGILSTSDVVLNHTANDTHWLSDHPECGYHINNSPHLKAAIELDLQLQDFSLRVARGEFEAHGVPKNITTEHALQNLRHVLEQEVLKSFNLFEWFQMDIESILSNVHTQHTSLEGIKFIEDRKLALQELVTECLKTVGSERRIGIRPSSECLHKISKDKNVLKHLLQDAQQELRNHCNNTYESILNAVEGYVRWERLECQKGPIGEIHWDALVPRYFTPVITKSGSTLYLANNGWVMGWDARKDFAAPGSLVYLSRSLVAWSDCIKLRYGEKPTDCPFLWDLMGQYCRQTAEVFFGIRLDNCHSTPLHVAKFCLQESRKVNPNLWVYAELFTGDRNVDWKFERELGLNALIRESLQSYSVADLAHHINEFGMGSIGKLSTTPSLRRFFQGENNFIPLHPTPSISLLFDCTHDNEVPQQKRTAIDALPNAAAVAASACAIGSSRGYDELIPKLLSVVTERRRYHDYIPIKTKQVIQTDTNETYTYKFSTSLRPESSKLSVKGTWDGWAEEIILSKRHGVWVAEFPNHYLPQTGIDTFVEFQYKFIADDTEWFYDQQLPYDKDSLGNINNIFSFGNSPIPKGETTFMDARQWTSGKPLPGIMEARKLLNSIHIQLGVDQFRETDVETLGNNIIIVTRHQPTTHRLCIFFIHCAFSPAVLSNPSYSNGVCYEFKGKVEDILLEARLLVPEDHFFHDEEQFINGLPSCLHLATNSKRGKSQLGSFKTRYDEAKDMTLLTFTYFPPGSVLILMTEGYQHVNETVANYIQDIGSFCEGVQGTKITREEELQAFSYLLYSCSNEEQARSKGTRSCYSLTSGTELPYAGIAGLISILDSLRIHYDTSHPLAQNINNGDWLFNYIADRLDNERDDSFSGGVLVVLLKAASWFRETFREPLRRLPRNILLYYLDWIVSSIYSWIIQRLMQDIAEPLRSIKDGFIQRLCLATLQFYSYVPGSSLTSGTTHPSLCAGLPHFSTGYMRSWGRDTFISLKGCLLVTGRFQEAKEEILGFARVMRHGLIPNLLDSGNNPRFNARDATWFFLQSIQDYCIMSPESYQFLLTPVELKYKDNLPPGTTLNNLADLIHFILTSHAKGIEFREWNAGPMIDSCMKDEGFNIKITLDQSTGLIFGGNRFNCGTWMDKMGSSVTAGNKGIPATPRDGAPIEIIGLLKSTLEFILTIPAQFFPYKIADPTTDYSYETWNSQLHKSLDSLFYIDQDQMTINSKDNNYPLPKWIDPSLINKTNIYRDSINATEKWRDYQLRPNFCIAIAVALDAFNPQHATKSLDQVSKYLFFAKTPLEQQQQINDIKHMIGGDDAIDFIHTLIKLSIPSCPTIQLGLKTLDPTDYNYRPIYDNDNRTSDFSIAEGFNYHNGPEWVWPVGYFLDAKFSIDTHSNNQNETSNGTVSVNSFTDEWKSSRYHSMRYLLAHREHIVKDQWLSLPEITNENGEFCSFGCPAQAWSIGTILGFIYSVATSISPPLQRTNSKSDRSDTTPHTGNVSKEKKKKRIVNE